MDIEFSPSRWAHRLGPDEIVEDFVNKCNEESKKLKLGALFDEQLNVPYGLSDREKVDIFFSQGAAKDAPVFLFLHGGYWQTKELSKDNNSLMAPPLIKHGAVVVIAGYSLAPDCTVSEMVNQVQQAVVLVARKFPASRGIYLSGHSAGGHLAAMMLSVDWSSHRMGIIKGICPISGIFDLRPIVETSINDALSLTESTAAANSPMLRVDSIPEANLGIRVRLPFAQFDPPVFKKQAEDYCKLLVNRGIDASTVVVPDRDHFDEIIELANEDCLLQQVFLNLMNLIN